MLGRQEKQEWTTHRSFKCKMLMTSTNKMGQFIRKVLMNTTSRRASSFILKIQGPWVRSSWPDTPKRGLLQANINQIIIARCRTKVWAPNVKAIVLVVKKRRSNNLKSNFGISLRNSTRNFRLTRKISCLCWQTSRMKPKTRKKRWHPFRLANK